MAKQKYPSVGINPAVPVPVQRELRKVAEYAFSAHGTAQDALAGLDSKVGKNSKDLLEVSAFVSQQVQASGQHPINLTGLSMGPSGVTPGTYTIAVGTKITVNSAGLITSIS